MESGIDLLKLEGHTDVVTGVAFSRDGKTAASGSGRDNTIRLWDLKTGKEVRRIDNANGVNEMAFSPDGRRLLSCHEDGTLRWWDVATGKELRRFPVQTDTLQAVALSADGRLAITGGGFDITGGGWKYGTDFALRLWDVAEGKELYCFKGHENPIIDLALSRDGRYALSGSVDGTMRQWRLPDPPPPEKAAAPKSDRELIVGTWKVVAEEVAGQPLPQEILDALKLTLTFTADNVIGRPEGQFPKPLVEALIAKGVLPKEAAVALEKGVEGIYHLDPTKTPKTFDLTYLSPIRKTALGIYALDGDTLKLCLSINPEQVADRPTEFATKGGGLRILVTLKRQPPEKVGTRNPFGVPDVDHPEGGETQAFAAKSKLTGGADDPNAEQWVVTVTQGDKNSLDGEWYGRWRRPTTGEEWVYCKGTAQIMTVGERVYILYTDHTDTFLIDTRRDKDRLVGRVQGTKVRADNGPCVLRIVGPDRLDGEFGEDGGVRGRHDFRRKLDGPEPPAKAETRGTMRRAWTRA